MGAARCARVPPRAPGRGARGGRPWTVVPGPPWSPRGPRPRAPRGGRRPGGGGGGGSGGSGGMWGTRRSEKVTLLVALKFFMLRSVRSVMCRCYSAPPAALTRPQRPAARTQTMAHAIPLARQASLGAAPPQAIAGVGVIAATRSRRRMSPARLMPAAPPHPAPRGARARCPRRAVSARLRVVCERTVLNLPHGGLLSCCERRHSLLSNVTTTWKHAHGISGLSSGATTGRTCCGKLAASHATTTQQDENMSPRTSGCLVEQLQHRRNL